MPIYRPPGAGESTGDGALGRSVVVVLAASIGFIAVIAGIVFGGPPLVRLVAPDADPPSITFGSIVDAALDLVGGGTSFERDATNGPEDSPTPTEAPSTPSPSPTPAPAVDLGDVTGSPHSANAVAQAWRSAGFEVTQEALEHEGFAALAGEVVGLRLRSGSSSLLVAAIVYLDSSAVGEDWATDTGERPSLRSGRSLPSYETVWWNRNVIAVVLERSGSSSQALEAFLGLGR